MTFHPHPAAEQKPAHTKEADMASATPEQKTSDSRVTEPAGWELRCDYNKREQFDQDCKDQPILKDIAVMGCDVKHDQRLFQLSVLAHYARKSYAEKTEDEMERSAALIDIIKTLAVELATDQGLCEMRHEEGMARVAKAWGKTHVD